MADSSAARRQRSEGRRRDARARRSAGGRGAAGGSASLDNLIHHRIRLGIVSALAAVESLTFNEIKALLETTDGNLSVHARKLEEADYVTCTKTFDSRRPRTEYRAHPGGPARARPVSDPHGSVDPGNARHAQALRVAPIFLRGDFDMQSTSRVNERGIHVAVIMDGNGRWARGRGLPRSAGHHAGVDAIRRIVEAAPDAGSGP